MRFVSRFVSNFAFRTFPLIYSEEFDKRETAREDYSVRAHEQKLIDDLEKQLKVRPFALL